MGDVGRHAQTIAGYRLLEPCGKGGMGAVYRARHVATDALVAVKVLAREGLRSPEMLQAFNDEVGAMASLDHPSIATILDYGTVPRGVEPPLAAGSPFLVMELARGGTLSPQCGRMQWPRTRSVLLAILDALGHAHARGVVHRDLKPANVLLRGARADVVVADFGLAHLLDADTPDEDTSASGTPSFMAPEQWRGDWRSFGPWTDLYALGCLAAALVQRRSPFKRTSPLATMRAHLYEAPADLAPWMPVPDGLDAWIRELVHKDPLQRFACAADAAHALRALAEAPEGPTYGAEDDAAEAPTVVLSQQRARPVEPMEGQWRSRPPPAPITADWRGRRAAAVPSALATASLGLCGLGLCPWWIATTSGTRCGRR